MSDDERRELFVERVSDESIDRIEGLAALPLRPRCATRGRPLVPGRKSRRIQVSLQHCNCKKFKRRLIARFIERGAL